MAQQKCTKEFMKVLLSLKGCPIPPLVQVFSSGQHKLYLQQKVTCDRIAVFIQITVNMCALVKTNGSIELIVTNMFIKLYGKEWTLPPASD